MKNKKLKIDRVSLIFLKQGLISALKKELNKKYTHFVNVDRLIDDIYNYNNIIKKLEKEENK